MTVELRYQVFVETPNGPMALSFTEMAFDSITIWACYQGPKSLYQTDPHPPIGQGRTPELAFQDLYHKKFPGTLTLNEPS